MIRFKEWAAAGSALAWIVAGAFLPKVAFSLIDLANAGRVCETTVTPVRLELDEDMAPMGKLAILSRLGSSIELSESQAAMSREEVLDALWEGIRPYTQSGLATCPDRQVQMYPGLILAKEDPALQSIVWFVTASGDPDDYTYLQLVIDDETGAVLAVSYTREVYDPPLTGNGALEVFAELYFTGLGFHDYRQFAVPDLEYAYVGDDADAARYRFGDAVYGEVNIDLYVHGHGFYIEFPDR